MIKKIYVNWEKQEIVTDRDDLNYYIGKIRHDVECEYTFEDFLQDNYSCRKEIFDLTNRGKDDAFDNYEKIVSEKTESILLEDWEEVTLTLSFPSETETLIDIFIK